MFDGGVWEIDVGESLMVVCGTLIWLSVRWWYMRVRCV